MRTKFSIAGSAMSIILLASTPLPANAADTKNLDIETVLAEVSENAPGLSNSVLESLAEIPQQETEGNAIVEAKIGDVDIRLPSTTSDPIVMKATDGASIEITLPFSQVAADASLVVSGVVAYDNNNGSVSAPVLKDDGSVQITTIIEGTASPTVYSYQVGLPPNSQFELGEGGGLVVLDEGNDFLAGIVAPWAYDANGTPVPTHFRVTPAGFEQIVDHHSGDFAYPIVADPWLGLDLVKRTVWVGSVLQVYPTDWARISYTDLFKASAGYAARWAGWDEVVQKTPGTKENTPSMRDQYYCHFDFVRFRAPNKASWNLDYGRPHVDYATLVFNQCNA